MGNRVNVELALSMGGTIVVYKFLSVFLDNLSGITLKRKVEFNIKLILGITLISKTPYCIAPIKLQESKK